MDHSFAQKGNPGKLEVFKGKDVNHFDDSYFEGKKWHLAGLGNNEKFYKVARQTYEAAGRNIIDATVDGKCNIFKKANYLDVMYRKPSAGRRLLLPNQTAAADTGTE